MEYAIEIEGLTKKYDGFALDKVSFVVPKGSIMGFIGQNGAGKTTTIKAMLNIIGIDEGSIRLLGKDHRTEERAVKEELAVVFDEVPFDDGLNGIVISKMFQGLYRNFSEELFFSYLERFAVPKKKKIRKLSKGMKMKLQIAAALSHDAKLLIMDEATTGLDPVVRNEILEVFREYLQDRERSILMSSHITSDLEKIADSVTFIDRGRVFLSGGKDEILEKYGVIKCTKEEYAKLAGEKIVSVRVTDRGVEAMCADCGTMKKKYGGLRIEKTTLEEIMLFHVNRDREWS